MNKKIKGKASEYIRHMPDFVIVNKRNEAFFVEVKFRKKSLIEIKDIFNYPNCYVILLTKNGILAQSTKYIYKYGYGFSYIKHMPPFENIKKDLIDKYSKRIRRNLGDENIIGQLIEKTAENITGKKFPEPYIKVTLVKSKKRHKIRKSRRRR